MRHGYRIFDTHTHIGAARHSGRRYSADDLLRDMDRHGIDRSVVIPFPVVEDERAAHDEIGRAVQAHADRLSGAGCLNPFLPEAQFREEMRRCREVHGFSAWKLQPQYQGLNPISSRSTFLFESALSNRMTLICHTGAGIPYALPSLFMLPARSFPTLRMVLAHSGGGGIYAGEAIVAAVYCPNIYLELSSLLPNQLREVFGHVPAERLLIGSDVPENLEIEFAKLEGLGLSDGDRRGVLWDTAETLFLAR